MSNTELTERQNVSEEHLLEQQFNDLLLEPNQDAQDEYFNCQEECDTLREEYILSTSYKTNIWVLPLTINTQQTPDHTRTFSPPPLAIDFLIGLGATPNVLKNYTWNEIKEYHNLQLKASTFVLSAANNFNLQPHGPIKVTLYQDVTEHRTHQSIIFTNLNFLGRSLLEKNAETKKCSSHTIEIKHNHEPKSLKFNDSSTK